MDQRQALITKIEYDDEKEEDIKGKNCFVKIKEALFPKKIKFDEVAYSSGESDEEHALDYISLSQQ